MRELRATYLYLCPLLLAAFPGCGEGLSNVTPEAPAVTQVTVQFIYLAPTLVDPDVRAMNRVCVDAVGRTHIHPEWRGFVSVNMVAAGANRWEVLLSDVPVDSEERIRVSDPNACAINPTGAATDNVFANETRLTRVVDTPGTGLEPGLAFRVDGDGVVTP
jgi:hypothetical protein